MSTPDDRARRRAAGMLSARERVDTLLDPGSFVELGGPGPGAGGSGVVTGHGTVDGRPVCLFAHDPAADGGGLGAAAGDRIARVIELAVTVGCPVVGLHDADGVRLDDGLAASLASARVARSLARAGGVVPRVSVVLGPCTGPAGPPAALADLVVMVRGGAHLLAGRPEVIEAVSSVLGTGDPAGSGSAVEHEITGVCHLAADDEPEALDLARELLAFLPGNNAVDPPLGPVSVLPEEVPELDDLVPDAGLPYDVQDVVLALLDGEFLAVQEGAGSAVLTGFGRLAGMSVGVVASRTAHQDGALDVAATRKAAAFVRTCDAFNVPVLTLVDVPGFLPDGAQEEQGLVRAAAQLLHAYATATVPLVTVVLRRALGAAGIALGSRGLGADVVLAWPGAHLAAAGAHEAVAAVHGADLDAAARRGEDAEARRRDLLATYADEVLQPGPALAHGAVDRLVAPRRTPVEVAAALRLLRSKRVGTPARKHGNLPL